MDLLLQSGILVAALAVLVKSADYFTHASERIGLYFGLSSFIVGATIVSIGGSLPELATSLITVLSGDPNQLSFTIDNIIGSNIANTLLVGGLAAIAVGTLKVKTRLIDVDLPFFFLSSALFLLFIIDGTFNWKEGLISLILLGIFITYTLKDSDEDDQNISENRPKKLDKKDFIFLVGGMIGIYFAAKYTVSSVLNISDLLKIESSIVTMIAVAIGTSLPEVMISVRAALAGKHSVALGNVFGSNTFNALAVAGIPSFFGTLQTSSGAMTIGIPFFIVASLGFIFTCSDDQIQKWEGFALLVIYGAFVGKLVGIV